MLALRKITVSTARRAATTQIRAMSSVINLSDQDAVQRFCQTNQKVLLYFTASWCGPCRTIKPVYEEIAQNNQDIAFGKIDVDENSDAAMEYQITAVPTFIALVGETTMRRFSGADPNQLQMLVEEFKQK